ncbi:hypothetical protein EGO58_12505 [Limosilactobacillus reuteri]|nr:hypothetical protein EGO58_12505 [Limosilactobacillus reuteri]
MKSINKLASMLEEDIIRIQASRCQAQSHGITNKKNRRKSFKSRSEDKDFKVQVEKRPLG